MRLQRLQDREDDVRAELLEALLSVMRLAAQQASQAASEVEKTSRHPMHAPIVRLKGHLFHATATPAG